MNESAAPRGNGSLIWDLPVRIMHWALSLCVLGAWVTQEVRDDAFGVHVWFGYAVLALVVTRIIWGFVGTRHARFSAFVRGPGASVRYARGLLRGDAGYQVGHNPLGAWMVLLLLAMLLAQALTGLFANDQIMNTGPLFGYVSSGTSDTLTSIHETLFDWLLVAIGLHVAAALAYLVFKRENLIGAMITGRKRGDAIAPEDVIRSSRVWLALLVLAGVATTIAIVIRNAPEASLSLF